MGNLAMKRDAGFCIWIVVAAVVAVLQACPVSAMIADGFWPREIPVEGGRVMMYQPQPEKLDGNLLEVRAAVSLELAEAGGPIFGAVWFGEIGRAHV